ncbi:MAG: MazF family transcriptional regulator [Stackebrandtia sp.]
MAVNRGELVTTGEDVLLVISGGMFNLMPDEISVIAVPIIEDSHGSLTVQIGQHGFAVPGWVTSVPKAAIRTAVGRASTQELSDVNNMLFRILATD